MNSKALIKELESNGWALDRVRGSHYIFRHPDYPYPLPVPHPKKDLPKGTLAAIRKQGGLN